MRPRKEREVAARMAVSVGVEEVIRPRIVLIHAFLDEAHAEHAGVEVEVLLRRSGDRGDVMKSVDAPHAAIILACLLAGARSSTTLSSSHSPSRPGRRSRSSWRTAPRRSPTIASP